MERNELTLEQEMRRVWDVEQVKQLMHKRVFLQTWDRRQEELDTLDRLQQKLLRNLSPLMKENQKEESKS